MAQQIPDRGTQAYLDYVISLAKGPTLTKGVINEPRMYFDIVTIPDVIEGPTVSGSPGVLRNNERFPVRLTHMTASTTYLDTEGVISDPAAIQSMALTLTYHDQYYMSRELTPLPAWSNKVTATPAFLSGAVASWDFIASGSQPVFLAKQDTLQIILALNDATPPPDPVPVTVTFTGFGMGSGRPYFLSGTVAISNLSRITLNSDHFRNDGNETIILTDMTVVVRPDEGSDEYTSLVSRVSLNVKQVGAGTGSWWFSGPANALMPAQLLGLTTGYTLVHQLPGVGQQFLPDDGITYQASRQGTTMSPGSRLALGFAGYIMVT